MVWMKFIGSENGVRWDVGTVVDLTFLLLLGYMHLLCTCCGYIKHS